MARQQQNKVDQQGRVEELKTLRDEIRLDLHLAGMDLRDEWKEIEKRLPDPARAFEQIKEATSETLEKLTGELRRFRARLRDAGDRQLSRIMSRDSAACSPGDSLAQALTTMWNRDVGWLPVVDGHGRVVGAITDRDAAIAAATRGQRMDDINVESVMARPIVSCAPWDRVEDALGRMRGARIRRLPVVGEDGALAGVITLGDIARASGKAGDAHGLVSVFAAITEPSGSSVADLKN
jgi:CBS domain-containing protein